MRRQRLRKYWRVLQEGQDSWLAREGEEDTIRLEGHPWLGTMLGLLNTGATEDEIANQLAGTAGRAEVEAALGRMREAGLLEDVEKDGLQSPPLSEELLLYLSHWGVDTNKAMTVLEKACVRITGGSALARTVSDSLSRLGISVVAAAETTLDTDDCSLTVCCIGDLDDTSIVQANDWALSTGRPWLLVQTGAGHWGQLGPFFLPKQTACGQCLMHRLNSNRTDTSRRQRFLRATQDKEVPPPDFGMPWPFDAIMGNLATLEVLKHLLGFEPPTTYGRIWRLDMRTLETECEMVLRIPNCPACGHHARQAGEV